ncbi:MAG: hypothetical protein GX839_04685 [Fastidiosipila sp.]|jgi:uncharacterized membrane protein|nr:hypothetical protein [Fastidiosipila sp.]
MSGTKKKYSLLGNTHPAVIAVWAALHAASALLPTIPIIGTGFSFSVGMIFAPLAGIFFGPIAGAAAATVGSFIGSLIAPHTATFGLISFIPELLCALVAGLVSRGGKLWPLSLLFAVGGSALWLATATGRAFPLYMVLYALAALAMVVGGLFARKWLTGRNIVLQFVAIWICTFASLLGASVPSGNFLAILMYGLPAELFRPLLLLTPTERAIFSLVAAIIGTPLLIGLPKIGVYVGPQEAAFDEEEIKDEEP